MLKGQIGCIRRSNAKQKKRNAKERDLHTNKQLNNTPMEISHYLMHGLTEQMNSSNRDINNQFLYMVYAIYK